MNSDEEQEKLLDIDALAWTYRQESGELEHDGTQVATGYSGAGPGKNNPEMESVANVGPIPRGDWNIVGPPVKTEEHGPYVLKLQPGEHTETHGRTGFLIHGDAKEHPGSASQGCVILPRTVREQVWESGDRDLQVVANPSDAGVSKE